MTLLSVVKTTLVLLITVISGCSSLSGGNLNQQLLQLDDDYQQSPSTARSNLQKLKKDNLADARPWIKSGYWSLAERDIERARIAFLQAKRLDNNNAEIFMGLGICADNIKDHLQAQSYYLQGLELDKYNFKLKNNLAISYILSQQAHLAIPLLKSITNQAAVYSTLSHSEKNKLRSNLSLAYASNNNPEKAYEIDQELLGQPAAEHNRLAIEAMFGGNTP